MSEKVENSALFYFKIILKRSLQWFYVLFLKMISKETMIQIHCQ